MVRKKKLDDEQNKYVAILNIYNKQVEKINQLIQQLNMLKIESEEYSQGGNFDPLTISNYSTYIQKMQRDIELQNNISKNTKNVMDLQKQKVNEAYIQVKSLENLKEKQKEQYLKELQLEEIKEIDDIINSRRNIA